VSFPRRNYGDIPVTVLRPVHVGDSTTSALLARTGQVVDDECVVVWSVCRGWGFSPVVHVTEMSREERRSVAHRYIYRLWCDWWGRRAQSFLGFLGC
jgi:hypothetical protein